MFWCQIYGRVRSGPSVRNVAELWPIIEALLKLPIDVLTKLADDAQLVRRLCALPLISFDRRVRCEGCRRSMDLGRSGSAA